MNKLSFTILSLCSFLPAVVFYMLYETKGQHTFTKPDAYEIQINERRDSTTAILALSIVQLLAIYEVYRRSAVFWTLGLSLVFIFMNYDSGTNGYGIRSLGNIGDNASYLTLHAIQHSIMRLAVFYLLTMLVLGIVFNRKFDPTLRQSQVNFKTFLAGSVIFALTCYMFVFRS
jgi:hypothetical protein